MNETGNAVVYELVNKETKEVTATIGGLIMGDGYVEANIEGGVVRFENPNKDGKLTNDTYYIREVGTHLGPDGVTNTDEEYGVATTTEETGSESGDASTETGAEGTENGEAVA